MGNLLFSVFTPTYNRAHLLSGVYESLCAQTCQNFEWIVVDDGSTDGTEKLIKGWIGENTITIRYEKQLNGGKHRAFNKGVRIARGKIFICLDSDDYYENHALETIACYYSEIKDDTKIAGFSCLTADRQGIVIGTHLPSDRFVCSHYDLYHRYGVKGDKGLIYYTDILKQYPFPEIYNEKFITEALVLNRISLKYRLYCIDQVLCRVSYQSDGLSHIYTRLCNRSPKGYAIYLNELNYFDMSFYRYVVSTACYVKYSLLAGRSSKEIASDAINRRWSFACAYVLGVLLYFRDRNKR